MAIIAILVIRKNSRLIRHGVRQSLSETEINSSAAPELPRFLINAFFSYSARLSNHRAIDENLSGSTTNEKGNRFQM